MKELYYKLNELIKSYHVFAKFDPEKAAQLLGLMNDVRLNIALIAEQRQIFWQQIEVPANASGYKNDVFFTHDDIDSCIVRMVAFLEQAVTVSLTQQGTRENVFTRQSVQWQQIMSQTQDATSVGQKIPFDFNQEIYLQKSETLDVGVTEQTTDGVIVVHGCNLKDDAAPNKKDLLQEINIIEFDGQPNIPKPQLVPILFQFQSGVLDEPATAVDGGKDIFSVKNDRSVILTEVSITTIDCRIDILDAGRNMTLCNQVEASGVAGFFTNQFTTYYPLPYPHLLRSQDRLQFRALDGSNVTGAVADADIVQFLCFRGFTI